MAKVNNREGKKGRRCPVEREDWNGSLLIIEKGRRRFVLKERRRRNGRKAEERRRIEGKGVIDTCLPADG